LSEMDARALVAAVLRPHHREHAQLFERRCAPEMLEDDLVLGVGETVVAREPLVDSWRPCRGAHARSRSRASATHNAADANRLRPSVPAASAASTACSGCGMRPITLPASFVIPAMSFVAP